MHRSAGQRAKLHPENIGTRQSEPHAAKAQEGIFLAFGCQAGDRLVATDVECPDGNRPVFRPFEKRAVGAVLPLFTGKFRAVAKQEFRAHQADAVAGFRIDRRKILDTGDVHQDFDSRAVPAQGGAMQVLPLGVRASRQCRCAPRISRKGFRRRIGNHKPRAAVDDGPAVAARP